MLHFQLSFFSPPSNCFFLSSRLNFLKQFGQVTQIAFDCEYQMCLHNGQFKRTGGRGNSVSILYYWFKDYLYFWVQSNIMVRKFKVKCPLCVPFHTFVWECPDDEDPYSQKITCPISKTSFPATRKSHARGFRGREFSVIVEEVT